MSYCALQNVHTYMEINIYKRLRYINLFDFKDVKYFAVKIFDLKTAMSGFQYNASFSLLA